MTLVTLAAAVDSISPVSLRLVAAIAALASVAFLLARRFTGPPSPAARRRGIFLLRAAVVAVLLAILLNPVRVDESPGTVKRPRVFLLLDASQSMALGAQTTRWDEAVQTIQAAEQLLGSNAPVAVDVFRFGRTLSAVPSPPWFASNRLSNGSDAKSAGATSDAALAATDPDTQLLSALRALTGRFGRSPPVAVVLFSDGRARDPERIEELASRYARLNVPIHVVPAGDPSSGGDVAVVSLVAPRRVRKYSQVDAQVFVRSYGYAGKRSRLLLSAVAEGRGPEQQVASIPITFRDGIQSFNLTFESDLQDQRIRASVPLQAQEASTENNAFTTQVRIDRTKVRVLYIEGTPGAFQVAGSSATLQDALAQDPDIECIAVAAVGGPRLRRLGGFSRGFPATAAELFAFDALVLSNVSRNVFDEEQLEWIDRWISQLGGGLCMAGGPDSFSAGRWHGSVLEEMLPVVLTQGNDWRSTARLSVEPLTAPQLHPIWNLVRDADLNRTLVASLPTFSGINRVLRAKSGATTLAVTPSIQDDTASMPVIAVSPYGKGRTMAITTGVSEPLAREFARSWGTGDNRYYCKFWRNAIYWLTGNSWTGRRRLIAWTDKRVYRPGETVLLQAEAYDSSSSRTGDYELAVMIEPATPLDASDSMDSPLAWPDALPRPSGEPPSPIAWGEEFELTRQDGDDYGIRLAVADSSVTGSATQSLRIELTAYEDVTQVDSTSLEVQIVDDPFEQQNPLPDHALLERIAARSRGEVVRDAQTLAALVDRPPVEVSPPVVRKVPLWSQWWLLGLLLLLLTAEWLWRRRLGLA